MTVIGAAGAALSAPGPAPAPAPASAPAPAPAVADKPAPFLLFFRPFPSCAVPTCREEAGSCGFLRFFRLSPAAGCAGRAGCASCPAVGVTTRPGAAGVPGPAPSALSPIFRAVASAAAGGPTAAGVAAAEEGEAGLLLITNGVEQRRAAEPADPSAAPAAAGGGGDAFFGTTAPRRRTKLCRTADREASAATAALVSGLCCCSSRRRTSRGGGGDGASAAAGVTTGGGFGPLLRLPSSLALPAADGVGPGVHSPCGTLPAFTGEGEATAAAVALLFLCRGTIAVPFAVANAGASPKAPPLPLRCSCQEKVVSITWTPAIPADRGQAHATDPNMKSLSIRSQAYAKLVIFPLCLDSLISARRRWLGHGGGVSAADFHHNRAVRARAQTGEQSSDELIPTRTFVPVRTGRTCRAPANLSSWGAVV